MRLPKFRFVILAAVILGVGIPIGFYTVSRFGYSFGSTLDLCMWPTSIILMATETHGHDWFATKILGLSVAGNVLYYFIILTFIWCVAWVLRAWRASLRDGTTI